MAGLYIHIPYCKSKCAYCDFYSTPRMESADIYIDALINEYAVRRKELLQPITTLYIGGGTPSSLSIENLNRLLSIASSEHIAEATIEVNPEDVTTELISLLQSKGINRISMGVQSFNDTELKAVGRRHNAEKAIRAIKLMRNCGVDNLSLDIIFGLPNQTLKSWQTTIDKTLELQPEHISAYTLMYESGTKLTAMLNAGKLLPTSDETIVEMYETLCEKLKENGYEHYEISNFGKPRHVSRHNSSYWDFTPYLGLGAAAHSYDGTVRRANPASVAKYLQNPTQAYSEETLTIEEKIEEYIMLRLRTSKGLSLEQFDSQFGSEPLNRLMKKADRHLSAKNLQLSEKHLRIPESHFLTADSIIVDLI